MLMTVGSNILGATLRLDLPSQNLLDFAVQAHGFLKQDRTSDSVIAVIYTDGEADESGSPPHEELMHCLELVLETEGTPIQAAWLVSKGFWRDFYCDEQCCPWPGQPVTDAMDSELNAELIYRGSSYDESLDAAVVRSVAGPWPNHEIVTSGYETWTRALQQRPKDDKQFRAVLSVWDVVLERSQKSEWIVDHPDVAAYLIASLDSRDIRDAVLVLAASSAENAMEGARACSLVEQERNSSNVLIPSALASAVNASPADPGKREHATGCGPEEIFAAVLIGTTVTPPLWSRLDRAYNLFRLLTAVAAGEPQCALLTMLGWIEWARGRGSRAGSFFDMCLARDQDYRLAWLLNELLNRGQLPVWATERESAWSGHRAHAA